MHLGTQKDGAVDAADGRGKCSSRQVPSPGEHRKRPYGDLSCTAGCLLVQLSLSFSFSLSVCKGSTTKEREPKLWSRNLVRMAFLEVKPK